MKLLVAIAHRRDAEEAVDALLAKDFDAIRMDSADGILREGKVILLMGIEEDRTTAALDIVREHCRSRMTPMKLPASLLLAETRVIGDPIQAKIGGALVFILNVDRFEQW